MKQQIIIDIPNGFEIDIEKSNLSIGQVAFKPIKPVKEKYPMSVVEVTGRRWYITSGGDISSATSSSDINQLKTEQLASAFLALMQLKTICDEWNRIDGFVVDWTNDNKQKWCVVFKNDKACVYPYWGTNSTLAFKDIKTAQLFLDSFKEMIETAKPLL